MFKKLIYCTIFILSLSGCSDGNDDEQPEFFLSGEYQEIYISEIENTLNEFYWYYDGSSITFFEGSVPKDNNAIYETSESAGYDIEKYSGKSVVIATADLYFFNNEKAGIAYFYFIKENLVGVYYQNIAETPTVYSLTDRNNYLTNEPFNKLETDEDSVRYMNNGKPSFEGGFYTAGKDKDGNTLVLIKEDDGITIYRYSNDKFGFVKKISADQDGMIPISACFYASGDSNKKNVAIIWGSQDVVDGVHEVGTIISQYVSFYDEYFNKTLDNMPLNSLNYSFITQTGEGLVMINDKAMEIYSRGGAVWEIDRQYYLNHTVTYMAESDLDNDGDLEYIISDNMDLFVYKVNSSSLTNIWRTNISIEYLAGGIYVADLNGDGAKELYAVDITGTGIRYILGEKGLITKSDDINFGEQIYTGDFNKDGKEDYIKTGTGGSNDTIYIAK